MTTAVDCLTINHRQLLLAHCPRRRYAYSAICLLSPRVAHQESIDRRQEKEKSDEDDATEAKSDVNSQRSFGLNHFLFPKTPESFANELDLHLLVDFFCYSFYSPAWSTVQFPFSFQSGHWTHWVTRACQWPAFISQSTNIASSPELIQAPA